MKITSKKNYFLFIVFIMASVMLLASSCYPSKKRTRTVSCGFQILEKNKEGYKNTKEREKLLDAINKKRAAKRDNK